MMASPAPQAESWQDLHAKARSAEKAGRINHAIAHYQRCLAANPDSPAPLIDAGRYVVGLNRNLLTLEELYATHRRRFGFTEAEYPPRVPNVLIGEAGWDFGIKALEGGARSAGLSGNTLIEVAQAWKNRGNPGRALAWHAINREKSPLDKPGRLIAFVTLAHAESEAIPAEAEALLADFPDDPVAAYLAGAGLLAAAASRPELGEKGRLILEALLARLGDLAVGIDEADLERHPLFWNARQTAMVDIAVAAAYGRFTPGEFEAGLAALAAREQASAPDISAVQLVQGFLHWVGDRREVAKRCFAKALVIEGYHRIPEGPPLARRHPAIALARALLGGATLPDSPLEAVPAVDRGRISEMLALEVARQGRSISAFLDGAFAFRAHYVDAIPRRLEHVEGFKLTTESNVYYAIPKDVTHFTIRWGKVFKVSPTQTQRRVQLPPYLMGIALWIWPRLKRARADLRSFNSRARIMLAGYKQVFEAIDHIIPIGSKVVLPVARFARRLLRAMRQPSFWNPKEWVSRLLWMRYRVHGAISADTREALLAAIAARKERGG